jgi:hypothetical protein
MTRPPSAIATKIKTQITIGKPSGAEENRRSGQPKTAAYWSSAS